MRLARCDEVGPTKTQRGAFTCGEPSLDRWLAMQARQSMDSRDAVTYLLLDENRDEPEVPIVGYYALAAGQVDRDAAPSNLRKRAPDPIPVVRMGRFAIDRNYQGQGWGTDLLREALLGAVSAGRLIGGRAMLVDAISEDAASFYLRHGFDRSPIHPMQMLKSLQVIAVSGGVPF